MQLDSLIVNANALLDLNSLTTTPNTCIGIKNGKIIQIVQSTQYDLFLADKIIDLKGKLLTPGLIDCHTHLIFAGNRANEFKMRFEGKSYQEIANAGGGIKSTVQATNLATPEQLLQLAKERVLIMQKHGVTTIEVKSGYGLNFSGEIKILEVAKSLGKQVVSDVVPTFLGAHAVPLEFNGDSDGYIDLVIEMLPIIKERGLAQAIDAFCEKIGFNHQQTKRLFEAATKLGFSIKLHAEQLSDQKGAVLASEFNALSVDHLEYLAIEDTKALAISGTVAVLLPGAFYFLKETKLPPVTALREAGVAIAIATDFNPGTSPFLSLPLVMNMACVYFGLTMSEVWKGVTSNAARALALGDRIGEIKTGFNADFAIWNCSNPEDIVYSPTMEYGCGIIKKKGSVAKYFITS